MSEVTEMADSHAHDSHAHPQDPNVSPMRQDLNPDFGMVHYWIAGLFGVAAIVLGTIFGLVLVNN